MIVFLRTKIDCQLLRDLFCNSLTFPKIMQVPIIGNFITSDIHELNNKN